MKKILCYAIPFALVCFGFSTGYAQTRVMLHHAGTVTAYSGINAFVAANTAAVNGDTIYLSGGFFTSATISKKLVVIGTGVFPDSTSATGISRLTSTLSLAAGSDSTIIEGLYIDGNINFAANTAIKDVLIRRNEFNELNITGSSRNNLRTIINQNIIKGPVSVENADALIFANNIFHHHMYNVSNALIEHNNIITSAGSWSVLLNGISDCLIKNNIFKISFGYAASFLSGNNNVFQNNILNFALSGGTQTYSNNLQVHSDSIFVNDITPYTINYGSNYHIRPYLYTTASTYATDGTEVGIYGGSEQFKFKEALVPRNPHIISKEIDQTTSADGKLRVKIKVSAQNK
ncbi:MAG TPA: right-handed parallel beta-helix repeat-containing protein [Bacteroidales bacterium]|nr:right-handed parallel beta-helix repeat-containing protein [Bacteroidales bacterium]HRS18323.1 right-handed parallel beta-helix repeat-containing protein [Bacteroidales bacterium]